MLHGSATTRSRRLNVPISSSFDSVTNILYSSADFRFFRTQFLNYFLQLLSSGLNDKIISCHKTSYRLSSYSSSSLTSCEDSVSISLRRNSALSSSSSSRISASLISRHFFKYICCFVNRKVFNNMNLGHVFQVLQEHPQLFLHQERRIPTYWISFPDLQEYLQYRKGEEYEAWHNSLKADIRFE